jgi:hypothetical protein
MRFLIVTLIWGLICALVAAASLDPAAKPRRKS